MATASILCLEGPDLDGSPAAICNIDNRGSVSSLEADLKALFDAGPVPASPGRLCASISSFYETTMSTVDPSIGAADWDCATMIMLSTDRDANGYPVGQVLIPASGDLSPLDLGA